jgi:hypothetical protein
MSEEENPEVEEQRAETEEVEASQPEEKNDALYKTLFDIAEEAVEEQEEYRPPVELNEAVATLDDQPEEEVVQEDVQEEAKEEEPKKTEPKKKKLRKVIDPDVPEDVAKQPAFTASNEDKYEPDSEDVEFMEELVPDERAVYEKVLYADKRLGGDYRGKSKQFRDFFKKNKEFVEKRMAEDDFYDPSSDEQYSQFVQKNKPQFSRSDEDKVYREMILEEADRRINKKTSEKIEQLEQQLKRQEVLPRVNQAKANFRKVAQQTVVPEEYQKEFAEGGQEAVTKFAGENPLEYQILEKNTQELLQFSDTLTEIFLDPSTQLDVAGNPMHKHLNDWLNGEQNNFIKSGQTQQEDGRVFMRRERYFQLPEDKRSEYYTWSDNDLLKLLALRYGDKVNAEIKQHREQMEKAGYTRVKPQEESQPQQQQQPTRQQARPPVVNPSPRQGSTVDSKQAQPKQNALMSALGL